jgi:hypothetical protein
MSDTGTFLDPREQMLVGQANEAVATKNAKAAAAAARAEAEKKRVAAETKKKRQKAKAEKVAQATERANWEPRFIEQYPNYSWMITDLDKTKYPDVFELFSKAVNPKNAYTDERFQKEFGATSWYREIQSSNKAFEIKAAVGTLAWDGPTYGKLLSDAVNFGWKDEQLKQETFKRAFTKNVDGSYTNPNVVEQIKTMPEYSKYAVTAKSFFSTIPQDRIEKVLTGELTDIDIVAGLRESAKLKYSHLSPAIDAGQTLQDLTGDYRAVASRLLERPEDDIDMSNADYEVALAYQDGSTKRMMTTGEWQRLLKTDKKYGWEKTKQAVDLGRDIGLNIVKSFQRGF